MRAGKKVADPPAQPIPVPRPATAPARSSEGEFLTWHPMPSVITSCPGPPPKQGHVAEVIGGHMYVFGGLESGRRTNTLHAMDLGTRQWQTMPPKGELPCGRSFAASWIWEGHLIVHGGETDSFSLPGPHQSSRSAQNEGRRETLPRFGLHERVSELSAAAQDRDGTNDIGRVCADDAFAFSPATGKWSLVDARLGPTPRRGHSICVARVQGEESALLFGGMQAGRRGASNEVYLLPLDNRLFAGRAVWSTGLVKGTAPTPRYGHTATVVSSSSLIVYGGRAGNGELLSDIYILDLDSLYWTHIAKVIGRPPPARYGHRACALTPPPSLLRQSRSHNGTSVWSGTPVASARSPRSRVLDVASQSQLGNNPSHGGLPTANNTVSGDTNAPSAAGNASARMQPPSCLLVFGGAMQAGKGSKSRTIFSHELYMFDPTRFQWSEVAVGHAMPNSRFGHSFAVVKELPPTRFYSDGRPVDKDKEDTATVSQQDHPCKVFALVFGGINAVYCNADTWMLELQWRTRAMASTTYVNTLKTHCPRLKEPDDFDDGGPVAQAALRKARIECSIAERELIRESRQRIAIQKKYDDLESYCSALQGQMKDVQSQSGDRARALQTALEQEKDRCTQLRTLNDEAFELMALQELRIALSWGSSDGAAAVLLQANPDVKNAIAVGGQRASNLLAEHRPKSPASVAPSEHKSVAFSAAPSPQRGNDGASMATDASKKPVSALASLASHRGLQVIVDAPPTPTPHTISMSPSPRAFNFVPLKHEPSNDESGSTPPLPRVSFFSPAETAASPPHGESSTDSSWGQGTGSEGDTLPTPITLSFSPKADALKPPGTPMRQSQQAPSSPPPDMEGLWGETAPLVDESSLPSQINFKLNKAPTADAQPSAPSPSDMVDFFEKFKAARAKEGLPPL